MTAMTFDRSRPLYRLFEMEDGSRQWWTVEADNTPGRVVGEIEAAMVPELVDRAPWRDAFYAAFEKHRKATVYAQIVEAVEVPDGVDGVLRHARFEVWEGETVCVGGIYGDRRGRWRDGHPIHTSPMISGPDENGIIRTRNSTYKVEIA